jgi:hypothetical protein
MKYMITGAEPRGESIDAAEMSRRVRYHQKKLDELLRERVRTRKPGLAFVSVGLGRETVTVKNRGGEYLRTDGPFPETKELVGGFNVMDFESQEEAIAFTRDEHLHQSQSARCGRFANSGGYRRPLDKPPQRFMRSCSSRTSAPC